MLLFYTFQRYVYTLQYSIVLLSCRRELLDLFFVFCKLFVLMIFLMDFYRFRFQSEKKMFTLCNISPQGQNDFYIDLDSPKSYCANTSKHLNRNRTSINFGCTLLIYPRDRFSYKTMNLK